MIALITPGGAFLYDMTEKQADGYSEKDNFMGYESGKHLKGWIFHGNDLPGLKGESEMQGMITLTKKDLIDFVNEKFADKRDDEPVASFFYCSDGHNATQQQCILFREAVENK